MTDYRGKGVSKDKLTKDGRPKRAGNFSYSTIHHQSLQSRDYYVVLKDGQLIVGEHTPLSQVMGDLIATLALTDAHFGSYVQDGEKTVAGKKHEAHRRLTRYNARYSYLDAIRFIYREEIYTDGDFDYNFPEY